MPLGDSVLAGLFTRHFVRIVTAPETLHPEPADASVRVRMADVVQDQHRVLFRNTQMRRLSRGSLFLSSNNAFVTVNRRFCRGRVCGSAVNSF